MYILAIGFGNYLQLGIKSISQYTKTKRKLGVIGIY